MPLLETARIGFSTASLAGCSLSDALRIGSEMGFQACELLAFDAYRHSQGVLGGFYFEHMSAAEKDELLELCAPYRRITTHAPFIDIASLAPNPSIRRAAPMMFFALFRKKPEERISPSKTRGSARA